MKNAIAHIRDFKEWWVLTLLSCLTVKWQRNLSNLGDDFDLIVTRRKNKVFILDNNGVVIDSIPVGGDGASESANLAAQQEATLCSDIDVPEEGRMDLRNDPPLTIDTTTLDILTGGNQVDSDETSFDLLLNSNDKHRDAKYQGADKIGHIDLSNVISLKRPNRSDVAVLNTDEDRTNQLIDSIYESEEDTVVVQKKQGKVLKIGSVTSEKNDNTVFFRNEGGKIRPVQVERTSNDEQGNIQQISNLQKLNIEQGEALLEYQMVAKLLDLYQGKKKCLYLLSEDKLFISKLSYPIETLNNIDSVLRYDLEKHIPLSFQEVRYFYALNLNGASKKVDIEVAVIKSEDYDELNENLKPFSKNGLFCTTEKFYQKYGDKISFLEPVNDSSWGALLKFSNFHRALNWVLLLLVLLVPPFLIYQELEHQGKSSSEQIARVKAIVGSINAIDTELKLRARLFEQVSNMPRSIELLAILSEEIDTDAWISRFSIKNNQIKIKGEAVSATSVSDQLSNTGLFERIKFISSIVKNPKSGKETFELLLELKTDA